MDLGRRPAIVGGVRPDMVVEPEVGGQMMAQLVDGSVLPELYLLVLDRAPQPLNEHVVHRPSAAIDQPQSRPLRSCSWRRMLADQTFINASIFADTSAMVSSLARSSNLASRARQSKLLI